MTFEANVDAAEYWARLEHRVSRELAGLSDRALKYLWCDGFTPVDLSLLSAAEPRITGRVWICSGAKQDESRSWPPSNRLIIR